MTNSELFKALCETNGLDVAKVRSVQISSSGVVGGSPRFQITFGTRWVDDGVTNSGQKIVAFTLDA